MTEKQQRQRQRRIDAGVVRQTARDAALLEWMSHMYGMPLDLIQAGLNVTQARAYQLAQRWERAGWVRRAKVDPGPTWVWPTRATCSQYLGWDADWRPRPTTTQHARAVAALRLHRTGFDLDRWISERTLRHEEGGYRKRDVQEKHVPDGIEIYGQGQRALIEVELTPKAPERYLGRPGPSGEIYSGLLLDVQTRAVELGCSAIAYWCSSTAFPVVKEMVARLKSQQAGGIPSEIAWDVRRIQEVPGWTIDERQQ